MEELLKRIVIDPAIMGGKPVLRSTRLTVEHSCGLDRGDVHAKLSVMLGTP